MSLCYDCRTDVPQGVFRCADCLEGLTEPHKLKKYRPKTEWEEMKSKFYSSDREWRRNIASRSVVTKNGKKIPVYTTARGEVRPMPKVQEFEKPTPKIREIQRGGGNYA